VAPFVDPSVAAPALADGLRGRRDGLVEERLNTPLVLLLVVVVMVTVVVAIPAAAAVVASRRILLFPSMLLADISTCTRNTSLHDLSLFEFLHKML